MSELTHLPPEVLQNHVAFLATSDAGKTYAAKTAIEDLLDAGKRICIVDPKGVYYGLRLQPDGRRASPYELVIFGGDHADVPLEGVDGKRLASVIAEGAFSSIIDTRRLTVGARTKLFADFAEGLSQFNSRPLHLVIDEAHLFAPQGRVQDFDSGRMVHAANELVSGGRSLGIRCILLSQRPAKLHKDSLSQVQTMVAMMNMGPQDRKAVADWIKDQADPVEGKAILASLPSLPVGHGWMWSPRLGLLSRIHFRRIRTFDSSATPDDATPRPTTRLAKLNLDALRLALAAEAAPIDATGATPAKPKPAPEKAAQDPDVVFQARSEGFAAGQANGLKIGRAEGYAAGVRDEWERAQAAFSASVDHRLAGLRGFLAQDLVDARPADAPEPDLARDPEPPRKRAARSAPRPALAPAAGDQPSAGARKLLDAIAGAPRLRLPWSEVAVLAAMSPTAGYTRGAINELRARQLILEDAGGVALADSPPHEAFALDPLDVVDAWRTKLGGAGARILSHLWVRGPQTMAEVSQEIELSPTAGYTRQGWKKLRSNGLVREVDGGWDVAAVLRDLAKLTARGA